LRLAALTGEHEYERHAVSVFRLFHRVAERHPNAVAHLLRALDVHFADVKEVALVAAASGSAEDIAQFASTVRSRLRPHLVLAGGPAGTEHPELMRGREPVDGRAAAYVCERFACQRPVTDPGELAALLER